MFAQSLSRKMAVAFFSFAVLFIIFGCEMIKRELWEFDEPAPRSEAGEKELSLNNNQDVSTELVDAQETSGNTEEVVADTSENQGTGFSDSEIVFPTIEDDQGTVENISGTSGTDNFNNNNTGEYYSRSSMDGLVMESPVIGDILVNASNEMKDVRPTNISNIAVDIDNSETEVKEVVIPGASKTPDPMVAKISDDDLENIEVVPVLDFAAQIFKAKSTISNDKSIGERYNALSKMYENGSRDRLFIDMLYARFLLERNDAKAAGFLEDVQSQIKALMPLQLKNVRFVTNVNQFGDFTIAPGIAFSDNDVVNIYVEVSNFECESDRSNVFTAELEIYTRILDDSGTELYRSDKSLMTRKSFSRLNDHHFCYRFRIDKDNLPKLSPAQKLGIEVVVKDLQAVKKAKKEKRTVEAIATKKLFFFIN